MSIYKYIRSGLLLKCGPFKIYLGTADHQIVNSMRTEPVWSTHGHRGPFQL